MHDYTYNGCCIKQGSIIRLPPKSFPVIVSSLSLFSFTKTICCAVFRVFFSLYREITQQSTMKWMKLVQFAITSYLKILFYFKKTCPGMYRSQVPERHFLCIRKRKNEDFVFIYISSSFSYQHNTAKTEGSA